MTDTLTPEVVARLKGLLGGGRFRVRFEMVGMDEESLGKGTELTCKALHHLPALLDAVAERDRLRRRVEELEGALAEIDKDAVEGIEANSWPDSLASLHAISDEACAHKDLENR